MIMCTVCELLIQVHTLESQLCFAINYIRNHTCKYNSVETGFAPQFHEMHHIAKPKRGMTSEHHTRLLEVITKISMDAGVMLQFV